jgi:L-aminopeptidase/D-esterase-like protein
MCAGTDWTAGEYCDGVGEASMSCAAKVTDGGTAANNPTAGNNQPEYIVYIQYRN